MAALLIAATYATALTGFTAVDSPNGLRLRLSAETFGPRLFEHNWPPTPRAGSRIEAPRPPFAAAAVTMLGLFAATMLLSDVPPVAGPFVRCSGAHCPRNPLDVVEVEIGREHGAFERARGGHRPGADRRGDARRAALGDRDGASAPEPHAAAGMGGADRTGRRVPPAGPRVGPGRAVADARCGDRRRGRCHDAGRDRARSRARKCVRAQRSGAHDRRAGQAVWSAWYFRRVPRTSVRRTPCSSCSWWCPSPGGYVDIEGCEVDASAPELHSRVTRFSHGGENVAGMLHYLLLVRRRARSRGLRGPPGARQHAAGE